MSRLPARAVRSHCSLLYSIVFETSGHRRQIERRRWHRNVEGSARQPLVCTAEWLTVGSRVTAISRIAGLAAKWNIGDTEAMREAASAMQAFGLWRMAWWGLCAALLVFGTPAAAQTTTNPNLNAQLLVA